MSGLTTSDPNEDRRREARLNPGDVDCEIDAIPVVHVLGLALGGSGMRVLTDKPLSIERAVKIRLHLSPHETLEFEGTRVWQQDQDFEFTRRYISGIKFLNPHPVAAQRLHAFIDAYLAREHPELRNATDPPLPD